MVRSLILKTFLGFSLQVLVAVAGLTFGLFVAVEVFVLVDPFLAFLIFGGLLMGWSWVLAHLWALFTLLCLGGAIVGVLVDKCFGVLATRWTEKRKREWNFRQHQPDPEQLDS